MQPKIANFPWTNGDLTKPLSFRSFKEQCINFLLIYCKSQANFIAKNELLYIGCPLTGERKQNKNPIFIFKSVHLCLRENVCLQECGYTEFDREVKQAFEKTSVSRAVCLRECPSAES